MRRGEAKDGGRRGGGGEEGGGGSFGMPKDKMKVLRFQWWKLFHAVGAKLLPAGQILPAV